MKRILVLTAGFGEGHNAAARNLREAIEWVAPDEAHVDVVDVFDEGYARLNEILCDIQGGIAHHAPRVWEGLYRWVDRYPAVERGIAALGRARRTLTRMLDAAEPDVVVSTFPLYGYLINEIYGDSRPRHFQFVTVVTDSISINTVWHRAASDFWIVPNERTREVMEAAGVPAERIRVLGFPVPLAIAMEESRAPHPSADNGPRILYMVNARKGIAIDLARRLAEHEGWRLTVTVSRDRGLRREIERATEFARDRVEILGWTSRIPELLLTHHVVVSKAGGATVQEASAARCPMIMPAVLPGQEEGNAELLRSAGAGVRAETVEDIVGWVERAFAEGAEVWHTWRKNLEELARPRASLDIAAFVLDLAVPDNIPAAGLPHFGHAWHAAPSIVQGRGRPLLCDLHTHTTYSDGKLTVAELVDFYGQRGFDVLAVTDHVCDPRGLIGRVINLTPYVIPEREIERYFDDLERARQRAWNKYSLLLLPGLEFNKEGYRSRSTAHLLGVDLQEPIDPALDLASLIEAIHAQDGLAIAAHPHMDRTRWGTDTRYLWEHQAEFADKIDAWEIANRDDLFNHIGLARLPYVANSDFHKPSHIRSWKTLLFCDKERRAIKQCIRENRDVAFTLFRDPPSFASMRHFAEAEAVEA